MSWDTDLAKELKARDNMKSIGAVVGTVLSISPFKIGIIDNQIMLDASNCYICNSLLEENKQEVTVKIEGYTAGDLTIPTKDDYNMEITYNNILHVGDKVLVVTSSDNQTFFIVDKLEVIT